VAVGVGSTVGVGSGVGWLNQAEGTTPPHPVMPQIALRITLRTNSVKAAGDLWRRRIADI
jgi:hypothetical protein